MPDAAYEHHQDLRPGGRQRHSGRRNRRQRNAARRIRLAARRLDRHRSGHRRDLRRRQPRSRGTPSGRTRSSTCSTPPANYEGHLLEKAVNGLPVGLAVDNSASARYPAGTQGLVYVTSGNTSPGVIYNYTPDAATTIESGPAAFQPRRSASPAGGRVGAEQPQPSGCAGSLRRIGPAGSQVDPHGDVGARLRPSRLVRCLRGVASTIVRSSSTKRPRCELCSIPEAAPTSRRRRVLPAFGGSRRRPLRERPDRVGVGTGVITREEHIAESRPYECKRASAQ